MPYLPLSSITVTNRQRLDPGDIASLASSISQFGLIQPIVITKDNRLVAGGRRLAAAKHLGWSEIEVSYKETLSPTELHILELEENVRRKSMTWQEHCLAISNIYNLQLALKAQAGLSWTQAATAELLGIDSVREVNHALKMAAILQSELDENKQPKPNARYWKCATISEAFRLLFRDASDLAMAELAKRHQEMAASNVEEDKKEFVAIETIESAPDALVDEKARYYSNPHNPPDSFDAYWKDKQEWAKQFKRTIHLSSSILLGDSIDYMRQNSCCCDHIITDIPYGVDMKMLNQQNPHGEMRDLDTILELHDVEYNRQLIADFFPAAFNALGKSGFVITWCDQMLWQYMHDCAVRAGFAVQKWPITWVKNNAMNQCVAYNTTKDTEIAIVCRKKSSVLTWQPNTSVIHAGKDDLCNRIDHPFAKPFLCWEFLIKMVSLEGQTILEPFAGRGSGVLSILDLKRKAIGIELDATHYSYLLENVKQFYLRLNPSFIFK